jgi:hypothetical protein
MYHIEESRLSPTHDHARRLCLRFFFRRYIGLYGRTFFDPMELRIKASIFLFPFLEIAVAPLPDLNFDNPQGSCIPKSQGHV